MAPPRVTLRRATPEETAAQEMPPPSQPPQPKTKSTMQLNTPFQHLTSEELAQKIRPTPARPVYTEEALAHALQSQDRMWQVKFDQSMENAATLCFLGAGAGFLLGFGVKWLLGSFASKVPVASTVVNYASDMD